MIESEPPSRRGLVCLVTATALCYLIGYPVAIAGHSGVGWVLVALGGPLLIALGITAIRRVHNASEHPGACEHPGLPPVGATYPKVD